MPSNEKAPGKPGINGATMAEIVGAAPEKNGAGVPGY